MGGIRRWTLGLLAVGLGLITGCFGVTQNASYFPYLLPTGDIVRTHAKPPGHGYFADFDPHACRLEVRPLEGTNPVQTLHVLIATVYDGDGTPRRHRRVEWMLEGAGQIVEVDESGYMPGRGYKVDNHYAVSYTDYKEHRITRGNTNPNDDFTIRPGQTWCVISSAVEGDTYVTAYAPEISNWDHNRVVVTKHWVDAEWVLPPPGVARAGSERVFTTNVFRHTDRKPLANYRVRYRILDGPPAIFLPSRTQEAVTISDLSGNASVTLAQVAPQAGVNRIAIEIVRPPDPCSPSGAGIIIGRGETAMEWQAPAVGLTISGPPSIPVTQELPYTIAVANTGKVETQALTVRSTVPEGLQYVRSEPPALVEGSQLTWTLGAMQGGQSVNIQAVFRALRVGTVTACATVTTVEGLRAEHCTTTQITAPQLKVVKVGPATGVVGMPITYQITVSNPGTGPANNVLLSDAFDAGLEHESRANPVILRLGTLAPNETRTIPLVLVPRQTGRLVNRVTATADGNLRDQAEHPVTVQQARLTLTQTGPAASFVDRPVTLDLHVANPGDVALTNVVVRDQLPPELALVSATEGGQSPDGRIVVWNLGTLQPRQERVLQVTARCLTLARRAVATATATADPGLQVQAETAVEIRGVPAYKLEVVDTDDPVEVGAKTTYKIAVTNQGTLPGSQVRITAIVPKQMRLINANGPTKPEIEQPGADGQRINFPPVDTLAPKAVLNYSIEVEALQPGDIRFRVELRSATLVEPVIKDESTTVYATPPRPRPAAPPAPNTGTPSAPAPTRETPAPAPPAPGPGGTPSAGPSAPPSSPGDSAPAPLPVGPPGMGP
jgi:uncharacterized repeat protein (TIGR01451 family)